MKKKATNVRDYDKLLSVVKTLQPVFTCLQFQTAAGMKTKWCAYSALYSMNEQKLIHKKKQNGKIVMWSLSPFPQEAPKKPLQQVFTTRDYGEYYNLTDAHRMLYRAAQEGKIFRVGRINGNGLCLWSFNPHDADDEKALKRGMARDIIPSVVKDPFANIFR